MTCLLTAPDRMRNRRRRGEIRKNELEPVVCQVNRRSRSRAGLHHNQNLLIRSRGLPKLRKTRTRTRYGRRACLTAEIKSSVNRAQTDAARCKTAVAAREPGSAEAQTSRTFPQTATSLSSPTPRVTTSDLT